MCCFGLLAGAQGGYAFDTIRDNPPEVEIAAVVLIVVLIGAGSKAGLVPLHVWLPLAHPAAPSHVSALMSGVMTKVAIYGFIRIVFDLLGPTQWWAGTLVLVVGGITALLGVLHAIMERDIKRLLAIRLSRTSGSSSSAWASRWRSSQQPGRRRGAGFDRCLFHALNHTVFKSLLFFGAGAVLNATGGRDLDAHGRPDPSHADHGNRLPDCLHRDLGLPPLNGFASEG